ncbi:MAG: alkaline phosphatase family protein [Candidatus Caldarchaeales archaeon]
MKLFYASVAIALVLVLALSYAAASTALSAYRGWINYENPYLDVLIEVDRVKVSGRAAVKHVVFILLDGLDVRVLNDLSREHEHVAALLSLGAFYPNGLSNLPTYSLPARASVLTGAPPEVNEASSNDFKRPLEVDSLVKVAKDSGYKILCSGDESFRTLFSPLIDECVSVAEGGGHGALSMSEGYELFKKHVNMGYRAFLWIGVNDVDIMGHNAGFPGEEYNATAVNAIQLTLNFLESLRKDGLSDDTLIVILNDHGFKRGAYHGGPEREVRRVFLLLLGPVVKPGVYEAAFTHNDIAPTVSMIMGWRIPANSMGTVLDGGLALPSDSVERYRRASVEQGQRVVGALSEAAGLRTDPTSDPLSRYDLVTKELRREGGTLRLALAAAATSFAVGAAGLAFRVTLVRGLRRHLIPLIAGLLAYEISFWTSYALNDGPFSLSEVVSFEWLMGRIQASVIVGALVAGPLIGTVGFAPSRKGLLRVLVTVVFTALSVILVSLAYALPFYVDYGVSFRFPFPDMNDALFFFNALMRSAFAGFFGTPLMAVAGVALFASRWLNYRLRGGCGVHEG